MEPMKESVYFVGAGSMAEALLRGITSRGAVHPERVLVLNRNHPERLEDLKAEYGVQPSHGIADLRACRFVVLATKPADCLSALSKALPYLDGHVIISLAAGISIESMQRVVQGKAVIVRTMPNMPVAVQAGVTGVAWDHHITPQDKETVLFLLSQVGDAVEIPESMMDAITAVSGSGPGFICFLLESMERAAVDLGFSPDEARRLLLSTLEGTAKTLRQWDLSAAELRKRVTSPNGTTHAGIVQMIDGGVDVAMGKALRAAAARSAEMSRAYAQS